MLKMIKTQSLFIIGDHLGLQVVLEVSDMLWGFVEGQCRVELLWRILRELLVLLEDLSRLRDRNGSRFRN